MYEVQRIEIPDLPQGSFRSTAGTNPFGLSESHQAFLTSDFSLTWLWGEYQRWKFVQEFKGSTNTGPEENLEIVIPTLIGLLMMRLGKEPDPKNTPEISYRLVSRITEELRRRKPEDIVTLEDPAEVINLRLKEGAGWHSDKIRMDRQKYAERCTGASSQWADAIEELRV